MEEKRVMIEGEERGREERLGERGRQSDRVYMVVC